MKRVIKSMVLSGMIMLATTTILFAQKEDGKKGKAKSEMNLSDDQKAMMKANREKEMASREALRATFTAEQKAIMANKELAPEQRRQALKESYTEAQKEMIKNNAAEMEASRETLKNSLTEEQKANMPKMGHGEMHKKPASDKAKTKKEKADKKDAE